MVGTHVCHARILKQIAAMFAFAVVILIAASTRATIISVPGDYPTIQAAIDAAVDNDTVLVAPGRYVENINYNGKNIAITSYFMFERNTEYIFNTIIDGSNQSHPDTGSTVIIKDNAGPAARLQGFTITGGTGTLFEWTAGTFDRQGGGIMIHRSSAIIQYNYIYNNEAINSSGIYGAGGGGIEGKHGSPQILNNIIAYNRGQYGCGIGMDYCAGTISNNVIAYNYGGELYGGAGIQKNAGGATLIENNTIAYNVSGSQGGGIRVFSANPIIRNNVIWYNVAPSYPQVYGYYNMEYCNVQGGGVTGTGNINVEPGLIGEYLYLTDTSSCIDAGHPIVFYNDPENPASSGNALWPAMGTLTSDIGAYGGPGGGFTFEPVSFAADTMVGWAPLEVAFTPIYGYTVNDWLWNFHDGTTSTLEAPSHVFETGGRYDISLQVTTDTGTKFWRRLNYINVIADTLMGFDADAHPGGDVEVTIYVRNNLPLYKIRIPVEYNTGDFAMTFDSFSTAGCRTAAMDTVRHIFGDLYGRRDVFSIYNYKSTSPDLEPGYGPAIKLYYSIPALASGTVSLEFDGFMSYTPVFNSTILDYNPVVLGTTISTSYICGDASGDEIVNLIDILYLISYKYDMPPGAEPIPFSAGDVNADGSINLIDILYSIDYLYGIPPGPEPLCP